MRVAAMAQPGPAAGSPPLASAGISAADAASPEDDGSGAATGHRRAHEFAVDPEVVGKLRMEGERRHRALAYAHRLPALLGDDLGTAHGLDQRRADEDARDVPLQPGDADRRFEAGRLPAVSVAANRDVQDSEAALISAAADDPPCEQDHARTGGQRRQTGRDGGSQRLPEQRALEEDLHRG